MKKKVLILCYDFPPLSTVGSLRPFSWFKHLHKHDIYPIIVTRKWSADIKNSEAKFTNLSTSNEVVESETGTIIYSANKPGMRDRLIAKYGLNKYSIFRRILTVRDLILGPFIHSYDEFNFLYEEAQRYLSNNKVDLIIATGGPFGLFKEASRLSKKNDIPWLADYRDPFSSNSGMYNSMLKIFEKQYKRYFEKRWTKNAVYFTTVSPKWIGLIASVNSKKGSLIRNGYDAELIPEKTSENNENFVVSYLGTIYNSPYLEILEEGIANFLVSELIDKKKVKFQFVGIELSQTPGTARIFKLKETYPENIDLIPSCSNKEAIKIASEANLLLNLSYGNQLPGIIHVKIYEYLALNKIILNLKRKDNNDKGEFDEFMIFIPDKKSFKDNLINFYKQWNENKKIQNKVSKEFIETFSRAHQTKLLADLIHELV